MTDDTDNVIDLDGKRTKPRSPRARAFTRKPSAGPGKGPGKGDGWGGPAKGSDPKRKPKADPDRLTPGLSSQKRAINAAKREGKALLDQDLLDHLEALAFNGEREETQLNATKALLDRLQGTPVQMVITDKQAIQRPMGVRAVFVTRTAEHKRLT